MDSPDQKDSGTAGATPQSFDLSAVHKKAAGFNISSGVLIPAIWPFLPEHFRHQDYAIAAVTAWFMIGNWVIAQIAKRAFNKFINFEE